MKIAKNKILSNISWLIVCRICQAILSLLVGIISARYLGPSNYGLINFATSLCVFVLPIIQLGIRNVLVQEIISNPADESNIMGTSLMITSSTAVIGILLIFLFVSIFNAENKDAIIICTLYSVSLLFQCIELIQYWFQAKMLSKYVAVVSLLAYVLVSIYRILLLVLGKSVYWFSVAHALDYCIISIVLLLIYIKKYNGKLTFSKVTALRILNKSKHYIISGIMVSLFSQTDQVMITNMIGEEANGVYSAALHCATIYSFAFDAIINSVRPVIIEKYRAQEDYEDTISMLISLICCIGLIISLGTIVLAKFIILFLYGQEFSASINVLRIITWYPVFSYMGTIRNIWMLINDKQNIMWLINSFGALVNVVLNIFLIPMIGACGAAFATVFTQFFVNVLLCFILPTLKGYVPILCNGLKLRKLFQLINKL